MAQPGGIRIEALATQTGVSTRNIRAYQSLGLLVPPALSGRVGLYGPEHVERLRAITRLQRRGFSLAGIRELLRALEAGQSLGDLVGLSPRRPRRHPPHADVEALGTLEDWPAGTIDLLPGPFVAQHCPTPN